MSKRMYSGTLLTSNIFYCCTVCSSSVSIILILIEEIINININIKLSARAKMGKSWKTEIEKSKIGTLFHPFFQMFTNHTAVYCANLSKFDVPTTTTCATFMHREPVAPSTPHTSSARRFRTLHRPSSLCAHATRTHTLGAIQSGQRIPLSLKPAPHNSRQWLLQQYPRRATTTASRRPRRRRRPSRA